MPQLHENDDPSSVEVHLGEVTLEPALPAAQLEAGDHGNQVEQLQDALVALGVMRQDDAEGSHGIFNSRTDDAVRKLQTELGVKADGIFGAQTLWAYDSQHLGAEKRDVREAAQGLHRGDRGPQVEKLQAALVAAGFMTKEDVATGPGVFGPRTERALEKYLKASPEPKADEPAQQMFDQAAQLFDVGRLHEASDLLEKLSSQYASFRPPRSASPNMVDMFQMAHARVRAQLHDEET